VPLLAVVLGIGGFAFTRLLWSLHLRWALRARRAARRRRERMRAMQRAH